jgi:nucleotide-binding universal stress UspA family protein
MESPILTASDGSPQALGALRIAYALAARDGRPLHVIAVLELFDFAAMSSPYPLMAAPPDFEERWRADLERDVRAQLKTLGPPPRQRRLAVEIGTPAVAIAHYAAEICASLIVVGSSRTTPLERLGASEMPIRIVQLAHAPLLVTPEDAEALPRRAVVGLDFSDFSIAAARAARRLVGADGEVHLVHVAWDWPAAYDWPAQADWLTSYRLGATARLEDVARTLDEEGAGAAVHTVVLDGDPVQQLLAYARRIDADLIAAGTHGHGFFSRLVLGSVSTPILRTAERAVLLVPPAIEVLRGIAPHAAAPSGGAGPADPLPGR